MSETELAWAAGFFDGEGCSYRAAGRSQYRSVVTGEMRKYTSEYSYPKLTLSQQERQPLERFLAAVGEGKIYGPYKGRNILHWQVTGSGAERAMARIWPYLSEPKRAQWESVLARVVRREPANAA